MLTILNNVRLLLLASWIGAAIFFSAVVAPTAFRVLRAFSLPNASEIAGTIVTNALSVINTSGFIVSLLLLAIAFVLKSYYKRRAFILQTILLAIVATSTGVGEWLISARMRGLRRGMRVAIDQVAVGDPNRIAFDTLHGYSVAALSIAIMAGLIAFFLIARRPASS